MYGLLTQDVKLWQEYPDVPWDHPDAAKFVNRSQLPPPEPAPDEDAASDRVTAATP